MCIFNDSICWILIIWPCTDSSAGMALCNETFQEFQMDKCLGKFCAGGLFDMAVIGERKSLNGPFLSSLMGKGCKVDYFQPKLHSDPVPRHRNLDDTIVPGPTPVSMRFFPTTSPPKRVALYYVPGVNAHARPAPALLRGHAGVKAPAPPVYVPALSHRNAGVKVLTLPDRDAGVKVSATLVPALSDAEGYKDEEYFREARRYVEHCNLVLYCIDMSDTRLRGSVLRTLQELKPDWSRTIIVLTFAHAVPALLRHRDNPLFPKGQYFITKLVEWTGELKAILERFGVEQELIAKMNVCPVADEPEDLLPNGEPWLPPLSLAIMEILSPENKAAILEEHATLLPAFTAAAKQLTTLSLTASTAVELMATTHVSTMTEVQPSGENSLQASSVTSTLSEDQSQSIRAALSKLRKNCPVFGILVIGRTGVGKSTLINNLLGKEVANVGHTLLSKTPTVHPHEVTVEGVPIIMYDTPGLGDIKGEEEEKKHLDVMKDFLAGKKIHLVVYCFQMSDTIMTSSLVGALHKYHQIGVDWKLSVIALTFADALYVPKREQALHLFKMSLYFDVRLVCVQKDLRHELEYTVGVESDVVKQLKICPTSLLPKDELPNGDPWYVPLWLHIVEILSPAATVRFLDIHKNNICDEQSSTPSTPAKAEVKLFGEYKQKFAVSVAAIVEAPGVDNSALAAAIVEAGLKAFTNLLNHPSEQTEPLPPPVTPRNQKESILSQNVNSECESKENMIHTVGVEIYNRSEWQSGL